jgi:hypothetical protein
LVVVVVVAYGYEPMPELTQSRLFGDAEEQHGTVTIPNERLYPFLRVVHSIGDEVRLEFGDGEISASIVDVGNVSMVEVSLDFDHSVDATLGANVEYLHGRLGNIARDAGVELELSEPHGQIYVEKGDWDIHERVSWLAADSIRESPEVPDLDLPISAEVDPDPIASYISNRDTTDNLKLETVDGELRITQTGGEVAQSVARTDVDAAEDVESVFSYGYLKDAFTTLRSLSLDTVTVELGSEFPIKIHFETEHMNGMYLTAPRISA